MDKDHRVRFLGFLLPFAAVLIFSLTLQAQSKSRGVTSTQPNQDPKASSGSQSAPPAKDADYVGAEACKVCHEDLYNSWEKTPHFRTTLDTKGGPSHQGCEGCHGPGKAHAESGDKTKIFVFKGASADEISKRCLTCHASGKEQMDFGRSVHHKSDVSCVDCHSPHHAKVSEFMLVNKQPDLCYTCHAQQKPQFAMPFHHRVNEGLVTCNDCHNPHGTAQGNQLRTSATQDAVCFKCHADKRGPFVFEHEPIKVEGCVSCHTPHGSPNMHMLKVSNVNLLCLSCHTTSSFSNAPGAPSFHNQATQYQACTICHSQIHGSNFDHTFFK
ncbi:MAG: DmsE family decaheme c-type cytochrome [Candidatus Acidiferrales bacterium]